MEDTLTTGTIDAILDQTRDNEYVTIFYGHGETHAARLAQLNHIIDGVFSRGLKIITQQQAYELLYG